MSKTEEEREAARHLETMAERMEYLANKIANSSAGAKAYHVRELKALKYLLKRNAMLTALENIGGHPKTSASDGASAGYYLALP